MKYKQIDEETDDALNLQQLDQHPNNLEILREKIETAKTIDEYLVQLEDYPLESAFISDSISLKH